MPVGGHLVGDDVLASHRQVGALVEYPPGTGDALLGVDHHVGDQPGATKRGEREQRRGGITAGVSDDPCTRDLIAMQLGQPVDSFAKQIWTWMLAVPLLIRR